MDISPNFDHILLFKTNISCDSDKAVLHSLFDNNPEIQCWNIYLDDSDYVLRIISESLSHAQIIEMINHHGYECCELT
ncbi:hypothetical protein SAMN05216464_103484 [Mucilaginibacter pineti]|uniref:HMA domain-containing protein n=1 Tax=Mucilaginibacter pineti TaxID=1391627 RepID=A0A1G6ZVT8_9SPHI|nr:hypothetical protein [Mucilaginibacter pineti]SDE05716.1 hypothetical protein SAMN05216464_103484 [Mucilaginibacter pineti]